MIILRICFVYPSYMFRRGYGEVWLSYEEAKEKGGNGEWGMENEECGMRSEECGMENWMYLMS